MSKDTNERYVLTLTAEQAFQVEKAMELYARLKLGQFNIITEQIMPLEDRSERFYKRREIADDILRLASDVVYGKDIYGIQKIERDDEFERTWLLYTVLRYSRCIHDYPEQANKSWSVCFDVPQNMLDEPMPKCEIKQEG